MNEQHLYNDLRSLHVWLLAASQQALAPFELTPEQFDTLLLLDETGGWRMGELTRRILTDSSKMTRIVDYLTEKGWVERRPDPADRRALMVVLTSAGIAHRAAAAAAHRQALERWFVVLTEGEKQTLHRRLQTIQNRLRHIVEETDT